jgi:Tol biopolymer transport system component
LSRRAGCGHVDGSGQVDCTNTPAADNAGRFSPDGTKIVFQSDRDSSPGFTQLYVMDGCGGAVTRLMNDSRIDFSASCSPDGSTIAFVSDSVIWTVGADGSNPQQLTADDGGCSEPDRDGASQLRRR